MPRSVLMAGTSCQITELRLRRTLHTWTTSVPGSAGVYLSLLATKATSNSSIKLVSACSTIRPDFQVGHQIIPLLLTRPARQEPCPFSDLQTPASDSGLSQYAGGSVEVLNNCLRVYGVVVQQITRVVPLSIFNGEIRLVLPFLAEFICQNPRGTAPVPPLQAFTRVLTRDSFSPMSIEFFEQSILLLLWIILFDREFAATEFHVPSGESFPAWMVDNFFNGFRD